MFLQQQGSRVEIAKPQVFSRRIEEVSAFINAAHIYQDEDKGGSSNDPDSLGIIICAGRGGRSIEGQLVGQVGQGRVGGGNSRAAVFKN